MRGKAATTYYKHKNIIYPNYLQLKAVTTPYKIKPTFITLYEVQLHCM